MKTTKIINSFLCFILAFTLIVIPNPVKVEASETIIENSNTKIQYNTDIEYLKAEEFVFNTVMKGETRVSIDDSIDFSNFTYSYSPYMNQTIKVYDYGDYIRLNYPEEWSIEDLQNYFIKIRNEIDYVLYNAKKTNNQIIQMLYVHDYIVSQTEYDYDNYLNNTIPWDSYTSYGALVNNASVCQGYAELFKYFMDRLGIECYVVSSEQMNHAWNIVEYNGNYYHIDATWDDPVYDTLGLAIHDYFMLSDQGISDYSHNHAGWNTDVTCDDDSFDYNAFWVDVSSPIYNDGTYFYYLSNGNQLVKRKISDGSTTTLGTFSRWYYSGLYEINGSLHFNGKNVLYTYPLNTSNAKITSESIPGFDSSKGNIYGSRLVGSKIQYAQNSSSYVEGRTIAYANEYKLDLISQDFTLSKITLLLNETYTPQFIHIPFGAQTQMNLTSSNPNVVSIENGTIKAVGYGSAIVTSTTSNGYVSKLNVTVSKEIETIEIQENEITIDIDESYQLNAHVLPEDSVFDKTVTWESSDPYVASVDQNGKVSGVYMGTATITATTANGHKDTCTVTVTSPIMYVSINYSAITAYPGYETQLYATYYPNEPSCSTKLTWTSSNSDVVTVDQNGFIRAIGLGTAIITVSSVNGKTDTCTITIEGELYPITSVILNKTNSTLEIGDTLQLTASLNPYYTTDDKSLTWTSSNSNVASVNENGLVTAKSAGTITITVTSSNGKTATCTITVKPIENDKDDNENDEIERIYGDTRYQTAIAVANALKEELGIDKFETVIIATGTSYPDALAGSYLAGKKNAPILMINEKYMDDVANYVRNNLVAGGKVYILGGENAVSPKLEGKLSGFDIERFAGANRFDTNLMILKEAGVTNEDILVCTGYDFADSLSASATQRPILLVHPKSGLNEEQKEFLNSVRGNKMYVIGGVNAVSEEIFKTVKGYAVSIKRIGGATRNETSVLIAQQFFDSPSSAVVAYSRGFADGLAGGPLAIAKNAPLILTQSNSTSAASSYMRENNIKSGEVLGGPKLVSDEAVIEIFDIK